MSFIDLKKVMEHGLKDGTLQSGDKLCPEMSHYNLSQAPMEKDPTLNGLSVLCIGEFCGKFNACRNKPYVPEHYDVVSPLAKPSF